MTRWERWHGPGFHAAVDWVTIEFPNLRAAYRWSSSRNDLETAVDIAAHAAMIGVSAELFETVGWVDDVIDAATTANVRRLPRLYTAAGYSCFTGRPELGVERAQVAARLEADPQYDSFEPGWSDFIQALAQVYCGRIDDYVTLTARVAALPGGARAFGVPGFVDGLQATGRVEEALDLVDEAVAAARSQGNPWLIAYASWVSGGVYAHGDPTRALAVWREGLEYVRQHRVHFFEGFMARDAALVKLGDADPEESLGWFEAAIDSFRRVGNLGQLTITLASVPSLFERIDSLPAAATLCGAITALGGDHHAPDLPELRRRVAATLGGEAFDECVSTGAAMDLTDAALYAGEQIQLARRRLATVVTRPDRPGDLSRREVEVLRLLAEGLTTREMADQLYISPKTADHHIQHIYTKIGVSNRASATLWAFQHEVVD